MKKCILLLLLASVLFLPGCENNELENFSFPLAMGIAAENGGSYHMYLAYPDPDNPDASEDALSKDDFWDGDMTDLTEGTERMSVSSSRNVDMNHLKVLILDRGMMNGGESAEELISFLRGNRDISWNAYVLLADGNMDRLFSEEINTGICMGIYLENLLEGWSNIRSGSLVTAGDLVSQYYNRTELLLIPVISISEEEPAVESFAVIDSLVYTEEKNLEDVFSAYDRLVLYKYE